MKYFFGVSCVRDLADWCCVALLSFVLISLKSSLIRSIPLLVALPSPPLQTLAHLPRPGGARSRGPLIQINRQRARSLTPPCPCDCEIFCGDGKRTGFSPKFVFFFLIRAFLFQVWLVDFRGIYVITTTWHKTWPRKSEIALKNGLIYVSTNQNFAIYYVSEVVFSTHNLRGVKSHQSGSAAIIFQLSTIHVNVHEYFCYILNGWCAG